MFNIFDDEFQVLINCSVFLYAVRVMGKRERANDYVQRRKLISERSVIFFDMIGCIQYYNCSLNAQ